MERVFAVTAVALGSAFLMGRWGLHPAAGRVASATAFLGALFVVLVGAVAIYDALVGAALARTPAPPGTAVPERGGRRSLWEAAGFAAVAAGIVALTIAGAQWRARGSVEDGAELIAEGQYSSAVRVLLPEVAAAPNEALAHYYLGLAYSRIGVRHGALSHLTEAVRLAPYEGRFHDGLGRAYRAMGDASSALAEFEAAARLDPGAPRYEVDLAGALLDDGQVDAAIDRLRHAVQLQPRSPELRLFLATTLKRAGDRDGMIREFDAANRLAGAGPLAEMARQELRATGWNERSPR